MQQDINNADAGHAEISGSGLFSADWYLARNPDVAAAGIDPLRHYIQYGAGEGRDPGPDFCTSAYLDRYSDVAEAGINPLLHYIRYGRHEGRKPGSVLEKSPKTGPAGTSGYPKQPLDLDSATDGRGEDAELVRNSGLFNENWYRAQYPAVADDPVLDYLQDGYRQHRNPGPGFDTAFYLQTYQDVADAGINPLVHYILYGVDEGRLAKAGRAVTLERKLWGGFSRYALEELEALKGNLAAEEPERISAAWSLMVWYQTRQDYARSLDNITSACQMRDKLATSRKWAIPAAWCQVQLGRYNAACDLLYGAIKKGGLNADCCLGMANTAHPEVAPEGFTDADAFSLHWINRVFDKCGLAPIKKRHNDRSLALNNLSAAVQLPSTRRGQGKISVIMPAFNAAATLAWAIASILGQTWNDVELIVVDDCSTDDTFEIAQRLAARDKRVTAVRQPRNKGAYAARNAGLRLSTGDYITVHDSDDWSHPQKLEVQLAPLLNDPQILGSFSFWTKVDQEMNIVGGWRPWGSLIEFNESSFLFRRSLHETLGEWDDIRVAGDREFIWRAEAKYGKDAFIQVYRDVPLSFSLTGQASLTQAPRTHVKTVFFGLRRLYREAARWWHRQAGECLRLRNDKEDYQRPFPVPESILGSPQFSKPISHVLISDFSRKALESNKFPLEVLKNVSEIDQVAMFHWPDYSLDEDDPIDDRIFEVVAKNNVRVLAPGERIDTKRIALINHRLFRWLLDDFPLIKCRSVFVIKKNDSIESGSIEPLSGEVLDNIESAFGHLPVCLSFTDFKDLIVNSDKISI
jgi:glycosyltransferase involved in cell wall biosynthesis